MFKGFSKKQSFNGIPQNAGFGAVLGSAYGYNNCVLHLDAGNGHHLINNTAVGSWTNLINGDTFTQATGANQPIYRSTNVDFNNQPVLQFDTTDLLQSGQNSIYQINQNPLFGAIFIVAQRTGSIIANGPTIFHNNTGGTGSIIFGITASPSIGVRGAISTGIADLSPHIMAFKPGASGSGGVWVDGVKYAGTWDLSMMNYNTIGWTLGGNSINGFLAEILLYNRFFDDADIIEVSNQLNAKYAIY
jgi:hypothetical protein